MISLMITGLLVIIKALRRLIKARGSIPVSQTGHPTWGVGIHKGPYGFAGVAFFVCQNMPDEFSIYLIGKDDYYRRTRCDQRAIKLSTLYFNALPF
jgi:hypothetical protein